jgi:hypothetical protein
MRALTPTNSSKPFSAVQVLIVGGETIMGKVFAANNAIRFEEQATDILRANRAIIWALLPNRRVYPELPLQVPGPLTLLTQSSAVQTLHHDALGLEQMSAYHCDKVEGTKAPCKQSLCVDRTGGRIKWLRL